VAGAVALGVDVADRVLADVALGEAADDLLGPGSGVREDGDESAVAQLELSADRLDLGRQEDVRLAAGQQGDPAAANPPPGALTPWGETFKQYFGIPWVGQSP